MTQWGRWRGNTDSSGMESGLVTCSLPLKLKFSNLYHHLLYFSPLHHSPPPQLLLFFFPSSSLLTLCIGSGVLAVMWLFVRTQLPVFAIGRCFFERALVSRVTGNGGTTSLFSAAASPSLPPSLPSALLWAGFCLSLPQAVVDQVAGREARHKHTDSDGGCAALPLLPLLLFHRAAGSHRDH